MSKGRADLNPKANSKTRSKASAVAMVPPLTLFGSPVLLAGEDDATYHELLNRVRTAINPVDIIDEMFIADVVSLEWEILRWRRLKSSLMQTQGLEALERFLSKHLDYYDHYQTHFEQNLAEILQDNLTEGQTEDDARRLAHRCAMNESDAVDKVNQIFDDTDWDMDSILNSAKTRKAKEIARDYLQRKPGAIKLIDKLLAETGSSIDALMAAALPAKIEYIERIDREALRRQVQEVEGEFEVIEKAPAEAKSAA